MGEYTFLFGPVPSRRLGLSLGVDVTPYKTCSQDCVYCQLGRTPRTTITRREYVPVKDVTDEIETWLKMDGKADYITLSGSGEPTLHACFGDILAFLRRKCSIQTVLLTNGSLFYLPEVRKEAARAHIVKVSLSAWDQVSYNWINRPHRDLEFNRIIEGLKVFRGTFKGRFWIEVFLVAGMNTVSSDVVEIASLLDRIGPDRIHLNTAVRPPAEDFVAPVSRDRMASLANLFHPRAEVIEHYKNTGGVAIQANEASIYSMLCRRPCTAETVADAFGMHFNEVSKYLGNLLRHDRIRIKRINRDIYYQAVNR
ncbi:MAG: radical SAM protein [Desulfobacterales bacterium]